MEVWWIVLALAGVFLLRIALHNRLVLQHQQVQAAWGELATEVERRLAAAADLAGLLRAELGSGRDRAAPILEDLGRARAAVTAAAGSPPAQGEALLRFEAVLRRCVELAAGDPRVGASADLRRIAQELAGTEDRIAGIRRVYNGRVVDLNRRVERFPSRIVARLAGIEEAEPFLAGPAS